MGYQKINLSSLLALITVALLAAIQHHGVGGCKHLWDYSSPELRGSNCSKYYTYFPLMNGAYCYNNGTGLCKAFSGQFEYYFNTFNNEYLYHAPESDYVDSFGYHKRIPISYNINGDINYVDRSINWARTFKASQKGQNISLLSTKDFNWCGYTERGWWPYKSSIIDYKSGGRYHIYFFNRQSCIFDTQSGPPPKPPQHFNTRFLHKSDLRQDLDYNPTMFAMEDELAGEVRLVKHRRQHWYEVEYRVVENPTPEILYFVDMATTERKPCKINGSPQGCVLTSKAFKKVTDLCLSDAPHARSSNTAKNAVLFPVYCGTEFNEISDYPWPAYARNKSVILEVSLHNIPRYPRASQSFYGVSVESNIEWEIFAKDGFTFSAMTTIPILDQTTGQANPDSVRVIILYSNYNYRAQDKFDEYYPLPFLADYVATCTNCGSTGAQWSYNRKENQITLANLNYVDDIAYLHQCLTVLIIFGPLYTELPYDQFSIDTKAPVDSIYELGIWELAAAFFAMPDASTIWVYHRTNWIASYDYTCASYSDGKSLVTAVRNSKYLPRSGFNQPDLFKFPYENARDSLYDYSEETLFEAMGLFKGTIKPEPPNPSEYPLGNDSPAQPEEEGDNTLVYIIIGVGTLLILAMLIICTIFIRRHRRRKLHAKTMRSSATSFGPISRSRRSSATHSGPIMPSKRSSLTNGPRILNTLNPRSKLSVTTAVTEPTTRSALRQPRSSSMSSSSGRSSGRKAASSSTKTVLPRSSNRVSRASSVSTRSGGLGNWGPGAGPSVRSGGVSKTFSVTRRSGRQPGLNKYFS